MGRVHQQKKTPNTLPFLIVEGAGGQTQFFEKNLIDFNLLQLPSKLRNWLKVPTPPPPNY